MPKTLFLTATLLLAGLSAAAGKFTYQGVAYTVLDEGAKTCTTTPGLGSNCDYKGDLVLPSNPKNGDTEYTLTAIGSESFERCAGLTSVVIPNTVTLIDYGAFFYCENLESVQLSESVTEIGESSFQNNYKLKSVTGGTAIEDIGRFAFLGCSALESIVIPATVKSIKSEAFDYCTSLSKVTYDAVDPIATANCFSDDTYQNAVLLVNPAAINKIKTTPYWKSFSRIFLTTDPEFVEYSDMESLVSYELSTYTGTATVKHIYGNDVTKIGNVTYNGREYTLTGTLPKYTEYGMKELILLDGVTSIPEGFCQNSATLESVSFPPCLAEIPKDAFNGCAKLNTVTFSEGLQTIGEYSFFGCDLTDITIPSTVTGIGTYAFQLRLGADQTIRIKDGTETLNIASRAFYCRYGTTTIYCDRTSLPVITRDSFYEPNFATLYVPPMMGGEYAGDNWLWFCYYLYCDTDVIDGVLYEARFRPEEHTATVKEYKSNDVKIADFNTMGYDFEISTNAGAILPTGDAAIENIEFGEGVTSIPEEFANGNSHLKSVTFGPTVKSIGSSAFRDTPLEQIEFLGSESTSAMTIGEFAFANNTDPSSLTSVRCDLTTVPVMPANAFSIQQYKAATLTVPTEVREDYEDATGWKFFFTDASTGIDEILSDSDPNLPIEVFDLNGVKITDSLDSLQPGIYIVRQGDTAVKTVVR